MGLHISHGAFSRGYGTFMTWRTWIAKDLGIPLKLMEGFYFENDNVPHMFTMLDWKYPNKEDSDIWQITEFRKMLPLKWSDFKPNPLHELLHHSDCDGYLNYASARKMIPELQRILDTIENDFNHSENSQMYETTSQMIEGFKLAVENKEKLTFG